jgi:hypothetical protein
LVVTKVQISGVIGLIEKVDFLVRFWELKARSETCGNPLAAAEQLELLSLMQVVTLDRKVQLAGPVVREAGAIPAQMIGDGAIQPIEIRSVTAAAILIATTAALPAGSQVILRIADAVSGIEFALPCEVTWAFPGTPSTMALAVDGIPTRTDFVATAATSLRMGPRQRLVG